MKRLILLAICITLMACANSPNLLNSQPKVVSTPTEAELFEANALGNKVCPIDGKTILASSHYVQVIVNEKSFRLCSKEDVEYFKASPKRYLDVAFQEVENRKKFMKDKSRVGRREHSYINHRK